MLLNDPDEIAIAQKTTVGEIEVLYWIVEDSLYKNKPDLAKSMLYSLLYIGKYNPTLIQSGLNETYKTRLQQLVHEVFSGVYKKELPAIVMKPPIEPRTLPFEKEKELGNYLWEHPEVLSEVIGEKIKITGREVETDCEFRCDVVAESKTILYPVELKIAQTNHQAVSQCLKYCYYFYRKLRYDRFKKIQGVVIGNGFDSWSVNELRRNGIMIFSIVPEKEGIRLGAV
jgi:hypothetical protein